MDNGLLEILKYFLLALLWLFFIYAARMVIVDVRRSRAVTAAPGRAAPDRRSEADAPLHLRVLAPPERRGRTFEVTDELTLGRSAACIIALEGDTFASSVHARIYQRSGDVWIEDLGSTNGTYLNDERLAAPTKLHRGDRVKVGSTVMELRR